MCLFSDILVGTAGVIGANSIKDSKSNTNEVNTKLPSSSQPLCVATTTTTTDLAGSSTSTNTPLPIIDDKCNVVSSTNQVSSTTINSSAASATATNSVLDVTNVNVGKFFVTIVIPKLKQLMRH